MLANVLGSLSVGCSLLVWIVWALYLILRVEYISYGLNFYFPLWFAGFFLAVAASIIGSRLWLIAVAVSVVHLVFGACLTM
jgi:hypothetical protein